MPKTKEVDSLHELAKRVVLSSVVECCRKLSEKGEDALIELREAVAAIKETFFNRIPSNFKADFLASLMNDCASFVDENISCGKTILEMMMDMDVVGLRLTNDIVRFLKPDDAPRLKRLKELHLYRAQREEHPTVLEKCYLNDVTSIKHAQRCTDSDLEIIGRSCPNLEVLDVSRSENVTDAGIHFLSSCPNLRVVKVDECPKVTHVSLSFLLSGQKKLEDFSYGYEERYSILKAHCFVPVFEGYRQLIRRREFDMLSGLDFAVQCPTLTRFVYENDRNFSPAVKMKAIVAKFPNLTCFRIKCIQAEDLSAIKHLNKLTELRVDFDDESRLDTRVASWPSLQEALTWIGANLTSLTLHDGSALEQDDVNFIFGSCPNLEYLQIDQGAEYVYTLDVPPFPKLKELILRPTKTHRLWKHSDSGPVLKFGDMGNLEILSIIYIKIDLPFLESIMLDNLKFPRLRVVKTNSLGSRALAKIVQTARDNNLDFCTQSEGMEPYHEVDEEGYTIFSDSDDYNAAMMNYRDDVNYGYDLDYDDDFDYGDYFENSDDA